MPPSQRFPPVPPEADPPALEAPLPEVPATPLDPPRALLSAELVPPAGPDPGFSSESPQPPASMPHASGTAATAGHTFRPGIPRRSEAPSSVMVSTTVDCNVRERRTRHRTRS